MGAGTNTSATQALSHPLVVWAAWLRVDEWYRSGNLAPQPELSQWRLHPEAAVRQLADELRAGEWRPSVWLQLPYPKKGACLRHYVMPTVKDQVAFMAYLVLLGPLLDSRFLPFVFGNRLYRPVAWNTRYEIPRWEKRRYPLLTQRTYLPYARSYGLFRRVANWTVSRMTKASLREEDYAGSVQHPSDYDADSLPPWVQEEWWTDADSEGLSGRAYWASLDIQLAYPSVRLIDLSKALLDLIDMPCMILHDMASDLSKFDLSTAIVDQILDGYPQALLVGLSDQQQRKDLSEGLVAALNRVEVADNGISAESWTPHHARATLPPENKGLPTGLAVSGLLLNVVLHRVDKAVCDYLAGTRGMDRGAVVRFADDMYLMAPSPEGLFRLIDMVWGAVEDNGDRRPIKPRSTSNLYINLSKVAPTPVQEAVYKCLQANGWNTCKICGETKLRKRAKPASLHQWWDDGSEKRLRSELARTSIGPGDVGPFVTTLVERLSGIGKDTLTDRFGQGAKDRQVQLHDLARFDIADEQVRADTRRTFAANRLAGAWLSMDRQEARRELSEIRRSVATVFSETPWKFALWGAVVRVASRRVADAGSNRAKEDEDARSWLSTMLRRVATHGENSWISNWPEEIAESGHQLSEDWRGLYLSFHRTAFWMALANVIRLLCNHHERHELNQWQGTDPLPHHWTTRAVPEGLHGHVAEFLGDIDTWTPILYGKDPSTVDLPRWELDYLVTACLAVATRRSCASEWLRCEQHVNLLKIPEEILRDAPRTSILLQGNGRCVATQRSKRRVLRRSVVAHLLLANRNKGLDDVLFPEGQRSRVRDVANDPLYALAVAGRFQCEFRLTDETVWKAVRDARSRLAHDPLALVEYGHARSVLLSRKGVWRP